ncbi:MAG: MerR family transcriptional regulator [Alphaproteobacteria bacterium]
MPALTIARAAREAGVNIETVRFYERRGLIERPPKGESYRVYSSDQIARIRFIKEAQQIGFSLTEIKELLALRADPDTDCSAVQRQAVAKQQEVRRKIEQLEEIDAALETLIAACPGQGALQCCSIMEAIAMRAAHQSKVVRDQQHNAAEQPMITATFSIEGMHCNGCASTIKTLLERQPGVQMATVSFADRQARILYDPNAIDEDRLVIAIEKPGFRVVGPQSSQP